ncbi:MAG: hypothetical protein N2049_00735 [Anaerolineales bacterium]|nr:hypothetical protein [Anaerolineales bacterium]
MELRPDRHSVPEAAWRISGLSLKRLTREGFPAEETMHRFATRVEQVAGLHRPVFVAFNAGFDWMFVTEYVHRYLGRNPFGHAALDIQTFDMALSGISWQETGLSKVARYCGRDMVLSHNAWEDALVQAELFRCPLPKAQTRLPDLV